MYFNIKAFTHSYHSPLPILLFKSSSNPSYFMQHQDNIQAYLQKAKVPMVMFIQVRPS